MSVSPLAYSTVLHAAGQIALAPKGDKKYGYSTGCHAGCHRPVLVLADLFIDRIRLIRAVSARELNRLTCPCACCAEGTYPEERTEQLGAALLSVFISTSLPLWRASKRDQLKEEPYIEQRLQVTSTIGYSMLVINIPIMIR